MKRTLTLGLRAGLLLLLPLLLLAALLTVVVAPAAAATAVATAGVGTVLGRQSLEAQMAEWEPRDVSDALTLLDISPDTPFDQLLRRIPKRRKEVKNIMVEYYRREAVLPRVATVDNDTTVGSAGATKVIPIVDDFNGTNPYKVNDVLAIQGAASTVPHLYVTAVSGLDLTVVALPVDATIDVKVATTLGTVPALSEGDKLVRLATVKSTGDTPSAPKANQSVRGYNLCELIDATVEADEDAYRHANYTQSTEYQIRRRETLETMRRDNNHRLYFGKRSHTLKGGKSVYTADGLMAHIDTTFSFTDGSLTWSQLVDLGYQAKGKAKGTDRFVLGGEDLVKNFDKTMLQNVEHGPDLTIAGVRCAQVLTRRTRLLIVHDPTWDEAGLSNEGVSVDFMSLRKAEYRPMEISQLNLKENGVRDARGEWFMERSCLEVYNPEVHLRLRAT